MVYIYIYILYIYKVLYHDHHDLTVLNVYLPWTKPKMKSTHGRMLRASTPSPGHLGARDAALRGAIRGLWAAVSPPEIDENRAKIGQKARFSRRFGAGRGRAGARGRLGALRARGAAAHGGERAGRPRGPVDEAAVVKKELRGLRPTYIYIYIYIYI